MHLCNVVTYLDHMKEEQIMKKVLLDFCYQEEMRKRRKTGEVIESLNEIPKTSPIVKKIESMIIN